MNKKQCNPTKYIIGNVNPNSIFLGRSKIVPFSALCWFFRCTWNLSKFSETSPVTWIKSYKFNVFSKSVRQEISWSKLNSTSSQFATKVRCLILSLLGLKVALLWKNFFLSYPSKLNNSVKLYALESSWMDLKTQKSELKNLGRFFSRNTKTWTQSFLAINFYIFGNLIWEKWRLDRI